MTTQRIVAVGQMGPDGDANAIKAAIEHIRDEQPDRVIATAGATGEFLRDLRTVYDGWVGAHLTSRRLCRKYGVEPLPELFELAPGWASYSGPVNTGRVPSVAVLIAARNLNTSLVSGNPPVFQSNSFSIVGKSGEPLRTNIGVGVGHLRGDLDPRSSDLGFADLALSGPCCEGTFYRLRKKGLEPSTWGPSISRPTDIEVDPGVFQRAFDAVLRRIQ